MKKLIRLDKCLTDNFGVSRKEAGKIIRKGLVTVNNEVVKDSSLKVCETDIVRYDEGEDLAIVTETQKRYFLLNKPSGYECSNVSTLNPIVLSLLEDEITEGLFCVGRLDLDTTGLLLITDDGVWAHNITSPKHHCDKVYEVTLAEPYEDFYADKLAEGVQLKGEKELTKPAKLECLEPTLVRITISEGKYHQVKRMFAALGNLVVGLKRIQIGDLKLDDDLEIGEYRELTEEEVSMFTPNTSN